MQGVAVGFRIDRDRANPECARGPDDSDRDLAAIGDEHRAEHRAILTAAGRDASGVVWIQFGRGGLMAVGGGSAAGATVEAAAGGTPEAGGGGGVPGALVCGGVLSSSSCSR